ncbi:MAG: RelA/SpoT family protein [Patescibacteria group bacterium]
MPVTIQQLIAQIKKNDPRADTAMIELAYEYAAKAHAGQTRRSGEPYIQHPLHTALTLAEIRSETDVVIAGLLHDVPEDTNVSLAELEKQFGKKVASLVEGITKLSKVKYRGIERHTESLKKMFIAMAADIRVILIRFADRLHNLETLDALPEEKRVRIAQETMEIYVPIAGLLGVWHFKHQMEDLCFKHLHPEEYKKLEYKYNIEQKISNKQFIEETENLVIPKLKEANIKFEIKGRFKSLYSIFLKMQKRERKFSEIYDVFALRVIVDTIADCYKTIGVIHSLWKPKPNRFKDYIAVPKPNGYQALHTTVFGPHGKVTEFQVATIKMYEESLYGIAAHWYYKNKKIAFGKQPKWVRDIMELMRQTKNSEEFVSVAKIDVFQNRIFVFTPKGDVIDLPENSSPIDFAYAVHSDIGNHCVGVMINDKINKLDTVLKSGDTVEIITEKNKKPSRDWMKIAKTARAREKIKQSLKEDGGFMKFIKWK